MVPGLRYLNSFSSGTRDKNLELRTDVPEAKMNQSSSIERCSGV